MVQVSFFQFILIPQWRHKNEELTICYCMNRYWNILKCTITHFTFDLLWLNWKALRKERGIQIFLPWLIFVSTGQKVWQQVKNYIFSLHLSSSTRARKVPCHSQTVSLFNSFVALYQFHAIWNFKPLDLMWLKCS